MNLSKILDVRSKTFLGVLLGVLGILIDATDFFPDLPKSVPIIVQVLGFVLAAFGVQDALKQSEENIIKRVKDFFTSHFGAGVVLEALVHLVETVPNMPGASDVFVLTAQIIGAVLLAMGLRVDGVKARLNPEPTSPRAFEKYAKLQ